MCTDSSLLKMCNDEILSKTISWIRFPLIVLVVLIHVPMASWCKTPLAEMICSVCLQKGFAAIAVPTFFFISGFLYFYKVERWSISVYEKKTASRIRTLLLPFLIWIVPTAIYSYVVCKTGLSSGDFWEVHKTPMEIFWGLLGFGTSDGMPLNYQFWFIRDLFVVSLLAPFWNFLISRFPKVSIGVLFLLWISHQGPEVPGLSTVAVFFFCFGAFFSIRKLNFLEKFSRFGWGSFVISFAFLFLFVVFQGDSLIVSQIFKRLWIFFGVISVLFFVGKGIERKLFLPSKFFTGSAFFVFALHYSPWFFTPQMKLFDFLMPPPYETDVFAIFFFSGKFLCLLLGPLLIYWLLTKKFSWILPWLTGGR